LSALELLVSTGGDVDDIVDLDEFMLAFVERDPGRALTAMGHAVSLGRDPRAITEALVRHLRNAFLSLMAPELVMLPSDQVSEVAKITKQYPLAETEVDEQTPVELTFEADGAGQTGQTGQTGTGDTSGNQNGTTTEEAKTTLLNIELDPTMAYGNEVNVYVEATPSDTNQLTVVFNQSVAKSNFPFSIPVTLAKQGTTHIIIKLNNTIVQEGDY
jgi:methionine-rich copper-binding protein CopC